MDRKKLEKQAMLLRNKKERYEQRVRSLRTERPKISNGAVVQQQRKAPEQIQLMSTPSPLKLSADKAARAAKLRGTPPSSGGCGCKRG